MSETKCGCGAETTNGLSLCQKCRETLSVGFVNVAAFHTDVLRIQPGERIKTRSAYVSTPPPSLSAVFDPISDVAAEVDNMLSTWCRALMDDRPQVKLAPKSAVAQCGWLEAHIPSIATLAWSSALLRDVQAAEKRLQRILDKSDTGWYAGQCGAVLANERVHDAQSCICECHNGYACSDPEVCDWEVPMFAAVVCERGMYASPGQKYLRCPECGTSHDTDMRRAQMMAEVEGRVAPVSVIARAIVGLVDSETSVERLTNRIDKWVSRKQLHDLGVRVLEGRPRRVYLLGDVLKLLKVQAQPKGDGKMSA